MLLKAAALCALADGGLGVADGDGLDVVVLLLRDVTGSSLELSS
jgi:hypothetical protein